jgi:hypothetical protein
MMKSFLPAVTAIAACGFFVLTAQAPPPAVFTAAQAAAGKAEYEKDCFHCHTDKLTGRVGPSEELPALSSLPAETQKMIQGYGGNVPALTGPRFLARWGAKTTKDLSARIMEASGPDNETRYLNLTAFILEYNGARPGTTPLTAMTAIEVNQLLK